MKGKLVKDRLFLKKIADNYTLHRIKDGILTIEGDTHYTIKGIHPFYKLSLKNCQAIERGYDLDELAYSSFPNGTYETSEIDLGLDMYKLGFQKALELMGDKKFSDVNMEDAYYFGSRKLRGEYLDFIKTFQQTEWEVTYNLEELDADGCLILKRI